MKILLISLFLLLFKTNNHWISIQSPIDNSIHTIGTQVPVTANTGGGVDYVEFSVDGIYVGRDDKKPWSVTWNTTGFSAGHHTLTGFAIDRKGEVSASAINVYLE